MLARRAIDLDRQLTPVFGGGKRIDRRAERKILGDELRDEVHRERRDGGQRAVELPRSEDGIRHIAKLQGEDDAERRIFLIEKGFVARGGERGVHNGD